MGPLRDQAEVSAARTDGEYADGRGDVNGLTWRAVGAFGAALGLRYHLTNTITLGLDYRFIRKDSNLPDADYYQNLAFLSILYKF